MKNIVDTAAEAGTFATLVAAVKAAGLAGTLVGTGPFTVFAPTDDAFKKLPAGAVDDLLKPENKDKLVSILKYHVVAGKTNAATVLGRATWKTLEGTDAAIVKGDKPTIDGANITKTDIECTNGYIHVIDAVMMPASQRTAAKAA